MIIFDFNLKLERMSEMYNALEESIENEDLGESNITVPFDPTEIDVDTATINLGSLLEMLEFDEIDLQPDFQRAADVWDADKKSRLIESVLLGLPLPSFYLSENLRGKKDIIDGLQRLCALRDFVLGNPDSKRGKLKLKGLEFLTEKHSNDYNGLGYEDLSREDKRRISSHKITINTIRKATPPMVKYIIFQRVNTAGVPLTAQEMRHALNQGFATDFVKELAEMDVFKKATNSSVKTKRMEDRDFVNRFLGFYLPGSLEDMLKEYKGDLNYFLNESLIKLNNHKKLNIDLNKIRYDFKETMRISFEIFGDDAFRKRYKKADSRKPISRSVFDCISVNIAWLTPSERQILLKRKEDFKEMLMVLFNEDDFNKAISSATGQYTNVKGRFEDVKNLISEVIE